MKPENVFIDSDGKALLADFGVARSMSGDTQLTMHGVAIGTPSYMAPEQIDGDNLDGRADVYSLGLVAWEMFTGNRPWEGESLYAVLYHQRHHELPDVRVMRPDLSDQIANAIAGAIEKDVSARWQSMDELIDALDGAAPQRRAQTHAPVTAETIRFERPPTTPRSPSTGIVPIPPAPLPAAPEEEVAAFPAHPGVLVGGRGFEPSFVGAYFSPDELEDVQPARRFSDVASSDGARGRGVHRRGGARLRRDCRRRALGWAGERRLDQAGGASDRAGRSGASDREPGRDVRFARSGHGSGCASGFPLGGDGHRSAERRDDLERLARARCADRGRAGDETSVASTDDARPATRLGPLPRPLLPWYRRRCRSPPRSALPPAARA